MKTIVNVLVASTTMVLAVACALLAPTGLDTGARRAAALTLQSYAVMQQAIMIYGRLPPCTTPPVVHLCRRAEDWRRVQATEKAASAAIAAAAPILGATTDDNGELLAALDAIDAVRRALADAQPTTQGSTP